MSGPLFRIGQAAALHPWRVMLAWLVVAIAAVGLNGAAGGQPDPSFRLPGAESQVAADALADRFPGQSLYTANVVFHSSAGLDRPQTRGAVADAVEGLSEIDHVSAVTDPFDEQASTLSEDGTTAVSTVALDVEVATPAMYEAAREATSALEAAGVQVEFDTGLGYAAQREGGTEALGIVVAAIVLAVAFGSIVAMGLPIGVALLGILIGSSAVGLLAAVAPVPNIANVVGLMLGLGVGIDYALFILSRFRQNLAEGHSVPSSVAIANATAGRSVVFAGSTVLLAILGVQLSGIPMLAMMGWGVSIMVGATVLVAVTLLPAFLGLAGHWVNRLRIPLVRPPQVESSRTGSVRWVRRVLRAPWVAALGATAVLVVLAIPTLSMRLGFADAGNDAPDMTTRKAYDLMSNAYGPGTNGPLWVVLESGSGRLPEDVVDRVIGAANETPGVAAVSPATYNPDGELAVIVVTPTTGPQDERTSELLSRLRSDTLPASVGDSTRSFVTGGTALTDDVSTQLQERMPAFLAAVIGLSFVVLTFVFRSVLVPLKAAALNLLGVGASYGVVVAIFQWGWGASLLGVEEAVPIMPLAPMLMFAILFGLSMDYEVFLLSRIRERYDVHGDAQQALVEGFGATGRVITSAGLIMIAVFGSFILASDVTTKIFGVGLGTAVLLDVTLIRMVLVPAVLGLLGDRAWWFPGAARPSRVREVAPVRH